MISNQNNARRRLKHNTMEGISFGSAVIKAFRVMVILDD
jgi:hypothetical protein